jgi:hypothetical protein
LELANTVGVVAALEGGTPVAVKIALRLSGLDLRAVESMLRIPDELAELGFQARGPISYAVLYAECDSPAHEAADWAREISKQMPGVRVAGVYDGLLGMAQIAVRCTVAPEAVRLWAAGKRRSAVRPFPAPREVIEQGRSGKLAPLFTWPEVLTWVRDVLGTDPDEGVTYLSPRQVADLNAELAHLDNSVDGWVGWHSMERAAAHVTARVSRSVTSTATAVASSAHVMKLADDALAGNDRVLTPARRLVTR